MYRVLGKCGGGIFVKFVVVEKVFLEEGFAVGFVGYMECIEEGEYILGGGNDVGEGLELCNNMVDYWKGIEYRVVGDRVRRVGKS